MNMAVSERTGEHGARDQLRALYQDYRKALLNVRCTEVRLARLKAVRTTLDMLLVVTSFGALAVRWLSLTGAGRGTWTAMVILTALIALLRVALPLTGRIARLEILREAYETQFEDLGRIVERVRIQQSLNLELVKLWSDALKRQERGTDRSGPPLRFSRRLLKKCEEDVEKRIPVRGLWMPQADVPRAVDEPAVCHTASVEDGSPSGADACSLRS